MVREAWCGVDVGTQGVRALLCDAAGTVLATGRRALPAGRRGDEGTHEQNPQDWWDALVLSVRDAVRDGSERFGGLDIRAMALDATSGTVLVQGADGAARGPALMYDDARAADQARRAQRVGAEQWDAMGYHMQASWALPKAMWLREQGAVGAGDLVMHQSDHLVGRLVGHAVATDTSNALKTGADLHDATWPDAVFTALGVHGLFPRLVLPGEELGVVGPDAAAATGLPAGLALKAGMTDGCAAQIASGALRIGRWSSALGTTLVIKGATRHLVHDGSGGVYCHRHPDGGWLPGGASSSGAGAIAQALPAADQAMLTELTAQAAELPMIGGFTYPLVGAGERFPFAMPGARAELTTNARTDAQRFAALCQAIAFVERLAYDTLSVLGADTTGTVAMTGGATGNRWWNQLRCDLLGREVVLPASSEAAFGMAILAAAPRGGLTATAERMVAVQSRLDPDPDRHAEYSERYRVFLADLAHRGWISDDVGERLVGQAS